jgi:hypothetical protein
MLLHDRRQSISPEHGQTMRNQQTLFIVGAGASNEAGLPLAKDLIDIVARKLDFGIEKEILRQGTGDTDILDILQQHTQTREGIETYFNAAQRVRAGIIYSNSIDSFIFDHRHDRNIQLCGKLAIAKTILEAERKSKLFIAEANGDFSDLNGLRDTWFFDLAKNITDGVAKTEVERIFQKVSFIIFNYDRCLEHFMYHALRHRYGLDEQMARSVMKTLKVIHPWGTIASLPWEDEGVPFGFTANRANMQLMLSRIKTYADDKRDSDTQLAIIEEIRRADTLVFLGFSYHPENMRLLNAANGCSAEQIFGTAKGISDSDIEVISEEIRSMVGGKVIQEADRRRVLTTTGGPIFIRNDLTCSGLLRAYARRLFAAGRGSE